jgi:hypothetical protein
MLAGLGFAKCYIVDIIVLNMTPRNHMHHLEEVPGRLEKITLSFIKASADSFIFKWSTWVT